MRWTICLMLLSGCRDGSPPIAPGEFDGAAAYGYVVRQLAFGPRISGSPASQQAGDWLDSLLRTQADTVVVQSWSHTTHAGSSIQLRNFIARFRPDAPDRILLLAHWDSRPRSDGPGTHDTTLPVPGANDGASGVAILLGVADALKRNPPPPGVGVDLLFVDGEDYGTFPSTDVLLGSKYYASHLPQGPKPVFAVLFDMVGDRSLQIYQEGYSLTGAPEVVERVWNVAARMGHDSVFIAASRHSITDDHIPLQEAGIHAIDVIDFDYPYWHTPEDTADKVSARSLQIVGDVALGIIRSFRK